MSLSLVEAPETTPVSLEEVKAHLRIDGDDDDENELLETYLAAAIAAAERYLRRQLIAATPAVADLAHMGAGTPILNLVLCMTDHIEWSGSKEPRRRRFEAKAIRQERQPRFDERLMRRLSLLPERHKQAVQDLRKLRRQHSQIVENAVQFDLEETLEAEANSKTFPLSTFLKGAYEWTKTVDRLMNA